MDQRHHGLTTTDEDPGENPDFSKSLLSEDAAALWDTMFGEEKPPTVLMGHSFGGAIAVWTAKECPMPSLQGLIVIDVVEGTAIGACFRDHIACPQCQVHSSARSCAPWPDSVPGSCSVAA
jgi:protein phosphatase methylesterase 1